MLKKKKKSRNKIDYAYPDQKERSHYNMKVDFRTRNIVRDLKKKKVVFYSDKRLTVLCVMVNTFHNLQLSFQRHLI